MIQHLNPFILPETGPWGRLICTWHEKREGQVIVHTYAASIDCKEGGIYFDCRPRKIAIKCLAQLVGRPFYTVAKTIYHLSMIPIFQEISQMHREGQVTQEEWIAIAKSLADIVRTPLYGIVITIATITTLVFAAFNPTTLYEGRKWIGKIEEEANWGEKHTSWTLAKCFQPFSIDTLYDYGQKNCSHDTIYPTDDPTAKQLAHFARSCIRHRQRHFDFFECRQLKEGEPYQKGRAF